MAATTTAFETELLQAATSLIEPTNFVTNPSFETDVIGWGQNAGTGAAVRQVSDGAAGLACLRQTNPGTNATEGPRTGSMAVPASRTYSAGVFVKGAVGGEDLRLSLKEFDVGSVLVGETTVSVAATTQWQFVTVVRAFGATGVNARIAVQSPAPIASVFLIDGAILVDGGMPLTYFDGDSFGYEWTGVAHGSTSRQQVTSFSFAAKDRGLMGGAAYKLRQHYLAGVVDPLAHALAKNNPRQVKSLTDNGKLASFDAIAAP